MNVCPFLSLAEMYDNLIGFVTRLDEAEMKGKTDVERIEGVSRFGVLLKINKSEISGYKVGESSKIYKFNFFGLTFARFRVLNLKKT